MRRIRLTALVIVLALGALIAGHATLAAQDATPPPQTIELAPGVTVEAPVFAEGKEDPVQYRLRFAPGASFTFDGSETLELSYVQAGELTLRLDGHLTTGGVGSDATAAIPAGTEVTVSEGDYFILEPFVGGEARNDGAEETILVVAGLTPGMPATPGA